MKNKTLWSLDLCLDLKACESANFNEQSIKDFTKKLANSIDPDAEIVGVITPFGEHEEEMKGFRLVHETSNALITGHFVEKTKNIYLNIHSCIGYKPSQIIELCEEYWGPEFYRCQKVFRE